MCQVYYKILFNCGCRIQNPGEPVFLSICNEARNRSEHNRRLPMVCTPQTIPRSQIMSEGAIVGSQTGLFPDLFLECIEHQQHGPQGLTKRFNTVLHWFQSRTFAPTPDVIEFLARFGIWKLGQSSTYPGNFFLTPSPYFICVQPLLPGESPLGV